MFSNLLKKCKVPGSGSSINPSRVSRKNIIARYLTVQLGGVHFIQEMTRNTVDFSTEAMKARRQRNAVFAVLNKQQKHTKIC